MTEEYIKKLLDEFNLPLDNYIVINQVMTEILKNTGFIFSNKVFIEKYFIPSLMLAESVKDFDEISDWGSGCGIPIIFFRLIFKNKKLFYNEINQTQIENFKYLCNLFHIENIQINQNHQSSCYTALYYGGFKSILDNLDLKKEFFLFTIHSDLNKDNSLVEDDNIVNSIELKNYSTYKVLKYVHKFF